MKHIQLITTECNVEFRLKPHTFKTQLLVSITITSKSDLNPHTIQSVETSVSKENLQDMLSYIENHAELIKSEPRSTSLSYADSDVLYSIQGLSGDYDKDEDTGYFSLQIFINTGSPQGRRDRIYLGAELFTNSKDVEQFIREMRQAIADMDSIQSE